MDPSKAQQSNQKTWKSRAGWSSDPNRFRNTRRTYRTELEPLTEAQQRLAEQFLPLARKLAKPLKDMFRQWTDEFESAACMALVEAARSYDPTRRVRFATFARFRIRGALVDVGRQMSIDRLWENMDDAPTVITLTPYNEEHGCVLVSVEPPPVGMETDDIDAVEHWLLKLPGKHRNVCRLYYLYGKTQTEIAQGLGCSQSEVARLHRKSIELLSEPYAKPATYQQKTWKRSRKKKGDNEAVVTSSPDPNQDAIETQTLEPVSA